MDNTLLLAYSRNLNGKKDDIFDITYLRKLVYMFEDTDKKIYQLKSNVNADIRMSNGKSDRLQDIMNKKPMINKSDKTSDRNQRVESNDFVNKKIRLPKIKLENKPVYSSDLSLNQLDTASLYSSSSSNKSWETPNFYSQVSTNLKDFKKLPKIIEKSSTNKSVKLPNLNKVVLNDSSTSSNLPNKPILKKTNKNSELLNEKYQTRLNKIITDIRKVRIEENIKKNIEEINRSKKEMEEFLSILNEFERNNSILGSEDNKPTNQVPTQTNQDQSQNSNNETNYFNSLDILSEDGKLAMLKCYEDKIYKDLKKIAPNSVLSRMNTEAYMNTRRNGRLRPVKLDKSIIEEENTGSSEHFRFVKIKTNSNLNRFDSQKRKQRLSKQIEKAMKLSDLVEKVNKNDQIRNDHLFMKENLVKAYQNWNQNLKML